LETCSVDDGVIPIAVAFEVDDAISPSAADDGEVDVEADDDNDDAVVSRLGSIEFSSSPSS